MQKNVGGSKMKYIGFIVFILCTIFLFFFFKKDDIKLSPVNLSKSQMCASDAMIIFNYSGPKAQILWKNGTRSFYCEAREAFYESTNNLQSKQIKAFYVQDFSGLKWGSYVDKWMLAKDALYVIDSSQDGAMGVTYVPFSDKNFANEFLNLHGGKLLKFEDINLDVLSGSNELLKQRISF